MSTRRSRAARAAVRTLPLVRPDVPVLVRSEGLPWFPFLSDGVHVKLCRANLATGEMVLMIRATPGTGLAAHYHHGVFASYTVAGRWRYMGSDWMACRGDVVVGPAGATQAFEAVGEEPAEAFVHLTGALEFRDESGRTIGIESAETLHGRYLAHCALHGIEPVDVAGGFHG
jgi:quercetin dioxygenase-like cupin family protein